MIWKLHENNIGIICQSQGNVQKFNLNDMGIVSDWYGITCQSDGNYMAIQCEWEIYGIDMGIMCQSLKIIWQFNVNGMGIVWV